MLLGLAIGAMAGLLFGQWMGARGAWRTANTLLTSARRNSRFWQTMYDMEAAETPGDVKRIRECWQLDTLFERD